MADRSKAIQYMEQACAVLEEHGNLVENSNPVSVSNRVFCTDDLLKVYQALPGGRTPLAPQHSLQHGRRMPAVCNLLVSGSADIEPGLC